ncbi:MULTISPECIES: LysR family transcriptional regulator [unclassified Paenibacillus]|uniref:LysR family transcriptional regulator n=1 Tax=unclassified Paenibacillus TaxID=185978 RepID=UPI001AE76B35|nr:MULTISPECIES: LysR family transcriptional regulator [unclassified Paenibacillus]MBP1154231.1 DNA-binding transcriptional LysR family regulator [Paenibacillus sp. PvP091]MBP1170384.1 DNA-binding transcriptional LysR family regulator [Paenibacillus sp. PvR098]MBP2441412.1 DNA-binding transcriptional LysR family regulator [Paenibacillus sp. PvP052]
MNIIHLQTFLTVCECKNFSEAAKQLFVPQPTISNRMRQIETTLGRELFIRGKRGVELTESGKMFIPYAEQMVQTYNTALLEFNVPNDKKELVIGSTVPFTFPFILEKIESVYSHKPDTNLLMLSVNADDAADSLLQGKIDIAFVIQPICHKEIEMHLIGTETLQLVLSKYHPLLNQEKSIDTLATDNEFVVHHQMFFEMFRDHPLMNTKYNQRFLTNHAGLIKQLIIRKNAIAFLPLSHVMNEIEREEITFIQLQPDQHKLELPYYLLYRKNERYFSDILLRESELISRKVQSLMISAAHPAASVTKLL